MTGPARTTGAPTNSPASPTSEPPAADTGVPAATYGKLDDGGFRARIGAGLDLAASALESGVYSFEGGPQPLPGVRLKTAQLIRGDTLKILGDLEIPLLEGGEIDTRITAGGEVSIRGSLRKRLEIPALGDPQLTIRYDETGELSGEVTLEDMTLLPRALQRNADMTGSGVLRIRAGKISGNGDVQITYTDLGSGTVTFTATEEGRFSGGGHIQITPPFIEEVSAQIAVDEQNNLTASATINLAGAQSPIPGLDLSGGTITVGYDNGAPSAAFAGFTASYSGLAGAALDSGSLDSQGRFQGAGSLSLAVPGLDTATGRIRINNTAVSGSLEISASAFPAGLVRRGSITAGLSESGQISLSGSIGVDLGPAGSGELRASFNDAGQFALGADVELTVPGLEGAQVSIDYTDGAIEGEAQAPIDTAILPGLDGEVTVRYREGRWSGETELSFSADDGKLSGTVRVTLAQKEDNTLEVGGSGEVTAQIAPRLQGTLTAEILPGGAGIDVSGEIVVTEPLELFPEKREEKELFRYSQNIPLWAILVAVIRVRAGVRAGIGPGEFRNIKVEGSYTLGADDADPSFTVSGELFIPAFVEGYVAFGAGLGLDVVLGSLTGGIEGVATAGLYGAISVIPALSYEDGDWGIEGAATLAAGARLKLGLNAWAEIEALWVTVWSQEWPLTEWVAPIGPDLALQAKLAYKFGRPEPPTIEMDSSDVDTESLIQAAMPKDGPPSSGARQALENRAEWQGPLREQRRAAVPPETQAQAEQSETPPEPATPRKRGGGGAGRPGAGEGAGQSAGGQAPPAGRAPGGGASPDAPSQDVRAAEGTDRTAQGAVSPDQLPDTGQPRYPRPISLATLDEPPATVPRTSAQEQEDIDAARRAIELVKVQTRDSSELAGWFPRIKRRFRLASLGYEGDFQRGFKIVGRINPQLEVSGSGEAITGVGAPPGSDHQTRISFESGSLGGDTVGVKMTADPLGPEHPRGSGPSGQDTLMGDIPTDPTRIRPTTSRYIRGHLLNDNLGGPGRDVNLFPITAKANADHHAHIEKDVKDWVNTKRYWVRYTVEARSPASLSPISGISGAKSPASDGAEYYVNAAFVCDVSVLGLDLAPISGLSRRVVIQSRYEAEPAGAAAGAAASAVNTVLSPESDKQIAAGALATASEDRDLLAAHGARSTDRGIDVQTTTRRQSKSFPSGVKLDLANAIARDGEAEVRATLLGASGFGPVSASLLFGAYNRAVNDPAFTLDAYDANERRVLSSVFNDWKDAYRDLLV